MFNDREDSCTNLPKLRDLRPSKKYREAVKRWGEPSKPRKRVVIVTSIKCDARDVEIRDEHGFSGLHSDKYRELASGGSSSGFGPGHVTGRRGCLASRGWSVSSADEARERLGNQAEGYRKWLAERKKLRHDLNSCGLNKAWLSSKSGRTDLENRVLKRLRQGNKTEIRVKKTLPKADDSDDTSSGQDRGVPTIKHPAPAALAIIQEYLERKKLRLVDLFAQADKDKNWNVTREEFMKIMRSAKISLTEVDLEDLILALDKDNDDALDYRELAVGRQAYLDERILSSAKMSRKEAQFDQVAGGPAKKPESIPEEHESTQEDPPSKAEVSTEDAKHRPGSPGVSSIPGRPGSSPVRPAVGPPVRPLSAGRPLSPGSTLPVTHHGRSDSAGSGGRAGAGVRATAHDGIPRSSSSPMLMVPPTQLADKVKRPTDEEIKEIRTMKQQKRKQKVKAQKRKGGNEKPARTVAPSSLGGTTAHLVDKYRQLTLKEYNDVVELCHMQGVQLSRPLLERVLLQPEDKSVSVCMATLRQPGNTAGRVKRKHRSRTPVTPRPPSSSPPSPAVKRRPRSKLLSPRSGSTSRHTDIC